ncbi:hypothetical protein HYFRA_00001813 [Hymenoscyphus fraxineus]|uniref:Uncharacterized protein n=1 Tax=Hymenoscyphus fraxineus TaxID=746836 RepID=A0A9N9KMI6_9HELO|nr:hypothetical protein HYFRA_00001813 [Hymenoscyphus fraxineus]
MPVTPVLTKKAAIERTTTTTTPILNPNPVHGSPKATPLQGAIIALGIISGLLIFGILLFMILYCHYKNQRMEDEPIAGPPFPPRQRQGPFPQARRPLPNPYGRPQMDNDPRNLGQRQPVPEMPVGSRDVHPAAANRQRTFSTQSGRQSQLRGENGTEGVAAQRQGPSSAHSPRQSQMLPGDLDAAAAAQRQRTFPGHPARHSQMMGEMNPNATMGQRPRGLSTRSARYSQVQGDMQQDMYGVYGSGLGGMQGLHPLTPQGYDQGVYHQGEGYAMPMPMPMHVPDEVPAQHEGRDEYSVEDPQSDVEGRRNSRGLNGHAPLGSRRSRLSVSGELGGRGEGL